MKSILISIKPKWVAKILNGEKTIEVRKTKPNVELPIDVYIYCTKNREMAKMCKYPCDKETKAFLNLGKVVAKFTLNKVEEIKGYNDGYDLYFHTDTMGIYDILHNAGFTDNHNNYEDKYYEMCEYLKPLEYREKGWESGDLGSDPSSSFTHHMTLGKR